MVEISPKNLTSKKIPTLSNVFSRTQPLTWLHNVPVYIDCADCDSNGIFRLLLAVSQNLLSLWKKRTFLNRNSWHDFLVEFCVYVQIGVVFCQGIAKNQSANGGKIQISLSLL